MAGDVGMKASGARPFPITTIFLFEIPSRSEEHTSELQSRFDLVCRLLLEKKNNKIRSGATYRSVISNYKIIKRTTLFPTEMAKLLKYLPCSILHERNISQTRTMSSHSTKQ